MWKNQANKDDDSDEVEAEKEDTDENKDQKFDSDNVALEDILRFRSVMLW